MTLFFLVTIHFNKKHYFLKSLSHLLAAQNISKVFFVNVIIVGRSKTNIKVLKIVGPFGNVSIVLFFKLCKLTTMNPVEEKNNFLVQTSKRCANLPKSK